MRIFIALLALPGLAISLFITHEVLEAIDADRLLWFLYWVMVPITIFINLASKFLERDE